MKVTILAACVAISVGFLGTGCKKQNANSGTTANSGTAGTAGNNNAAAAKSTKAMCDLEPTKGNKAKGMVMFTEENGEVKVVADIEGLEPNSTHALHIHAGTECGDDGMKAGGHYNPENHKHGMPDAAEHHAGDFGNLKADASGKAHLELTVKDITINGAKDPIAGHAMILHEKADDGTSQPAGNAGSRIACGLIKAE